MKFHFEFEKLFLIFAVLGDKELEAIAKPFARNTELAWTVSTNHPRSRDATDVALRMNALGINARAATNFDQALQSAREHASPHGVILITGSLSIVAQAREHFGLAQNQDPPLE